MSALGVRMREGSLSLAEMTRLTAIAEEAGYDSAWLPESHGRDAVAELIVLAGASKRITIATGIVPVFGRQPTHAATAMAVAGTVAPGRVILGIGIGHKDHLETAHGVRDFGRPLTRTREFAQIARALLRGETVEHAGDAFAIGHYKVECPPPRPVPVYVAALRPAMLRMTGAVADGVIMNWATPDRVREAITHIRAGAEAAGRDPAELRIASYLRTCVTDDPQKVEKTSRVQIARYGSMVYYRNYFAEIGFADEAAALEAAWARGDADGAVSLINPRMIRALTVYGTAAECRARLAEYRAAGLDLPIVAPFPVGEPVAETFERTIAGCAGG
jgi:probable F420-dependent oxidoreductase